MNRVKLQPATRIARCRWPGTGHTVGRRNERGVVWGKCREAVVHGGESLVFEPVGHGLVALALEVVAHRDREGGVDGAGGVAPKETEDEEVRELWRVAEGAAPG